jgi:hypothetical protein
LGNDNQNETTTSVLGVTATGNETTTSVVGVTATGDSGTTGFALRCHVCITYDQGCGTDSKYLVTCPPASDKYCVKANRTISGDTFVYRNCSAEKYEGTITNENDVTATWDSCTTDCCNGDDLGNGNQNETTTSVVGVTATGDSGITDGCNGDDLGNGNQNETTTSVVGVTATVDSGTTDGIDNQNGGNQNVGNHGNRRYAVNIIVAIVGLFVVGLTLY